MKQKPKQKKINLALQGGGAHGAFSWGVLDAILEDGRLDIEGISATSAGSMNAAMYAHGLATGGADGARALLEKFWQRVSEMGAVFSPVKRTPADWLSAYNPLASAWSLEKSPFYALFEGMTRVLSPYQFNPLNYNPLRDIIKELLDVDAVHSCQDVKLFITATNVRTGTGRVFLNKDIDIDVLCASACLPFLFQAVEIDGDHYWDGGYMGNPSLWPLFYKTDVHDVLIVHINPIKRADLPRESYDIENRVNEITFNASMMHELRAIAFVQKLIEDDMLKPAAKKQYRHIRMHAIRADDVLSDLSIASKFDTSWPFLCRLRDLGRDTAREWLAVNFHDIGQRSTIDIQRDYLSIGRKKAG